ncbi:Gamma-tubulin complex component 3 [Auxenochlorella protothecoides]|uniref:Gamma-tubulin complex component 3 n=1 Tax=Auxenochlorella protothecoides TaxID=3075 RepID=A0A087SRQ5_AUXPR|nr:Gamma-tubulin complex component 3 [Auxenochlorella protothecoides]KFM28409.1 Gamma-tubulin complex component 3 [Auxenochlorella protothecoides]
MVLPEHILVQEALHACQGISGRYVWWQPGKDGGSFALGPGAEVPPAQRQAVSRVAEVGALLRRIEELRRDPPSPLHEALGSAASREVSSLLRLLAILEARAGTRSDALTLRRLEPRLVPGALARSILDAGRTVNFLKHVCGDVGWEEGVAAHAGALCPPWGSCLQLKWLENAVTGVQQAASAHLLQHLHRAHGLERHLLALKHHMLMGRGDFVSALLDLAEPELDKPARQVSQYVLQGHLDAALRASTASSQDTDVADRLTVRLARALEGDSGWDVFSLQYAVDGALAAVLAPSAMASYLRVFRLLWTIKRVERVLGRAWARLNDAAHAMATLRALEKEHGVDVSGAEKVPTMLRAFHSWRSEAAQFASSLQSYIALEVIEPAWAEFGACLGKARDLDEVVGLHEGMLAKLVEGLFLGGTGPGLGGSSLGGQQGASAAPDPHTGLRAALISMAALLEPIHGLAGLVEQAVAAQRGYLARVKESETSGTWTDEVYNSPEIEAEALTELHGAMWQAHAAYERHFRTFLSLLPAQSHLDLRFFLSRFEEGGPSGPGGTALDFG